MYLAYASDAGHCFVFGGIKQFISDCNEGIAK